jgi:hypothetical protein
MCKTGLLDAVKRRNRWRIKPWRFCGARFDSARILWFHRVMKQTDHFAALLAADLPRRVSTPLSDIDLVKEFRATETRLLDLMPIDTVSGWVDTITVRGPAIGGV